jgi:hypothetical protein
MKYTGWALAPIKTMPQPSQDRPAGRSCKAKTGANTGKIKSLERVVSQ